MTDNTRNQFAPDIDNFGANLNPIRTGKNVMLSTRTWIRRSAALLGLSTALAITGCEKKPLIEVTVKPGIGIEPVEGESADSGESTVAAGYGSLSGTITYEGDAPSLAPLVSVGDSKVKAEDRSICAAEPVPDESLVVNSANKGLANVVIYLEKRPGNIKPELAKPPTDPVYFDQKGCRFLPHVLAVQVGQPLLIVSDDAIPHNTHTFPKRNNAFNALIKAGDRTGTRCDYKKAETGPLNVTCDYHPWMKAYHFPVDHPYFAISDKDGKFKIEGLPAGKHSFNVWHERAPGGSQLLERKLQITIEVDQDTVKDLSYGGSKFAAVPTAPRRSIAYERLLDGGAITVSQTEGPR